MRTAPLVSVILAAHDAEPFVRDAIESVLRQTHRELELILVDDCSTDATRELVARQSDARVVTLRNEEPLGLAASLNRGLDVARGRYVARLDADDVALPRRLELQRERIEAAPPVAIVGSGVLVLDQDDRPGALHTMPGGVDAVRWHALFSAPFFHPTVLLDREVLERHSLRYDTEFLESEDYDLWARVLAVAEGDNLAEPLVLYRSHPAQASQRRRALQREFQLRVATREISRLTPALTPEEVELAWRIGAGEEVAAERIGDATSAFRELLQAFEGGGRRGVRTAAARALVRAARGAGRAERRRALAEALRLDPSLPVSVPAERARRMRVQRRTRREAASWLRDLHTSTAPLVVAPPRRVRVAAVFPEPTPYRAPLLDRVAALEDVDLRVIYAAPTVARRTWQVEQRHHATFLRGVRLPGAARILRHDYPLTPGVARALGRVRPHVVVVSGWSTFAAQGAIAWCRLHGVPYVLVVESHDEGPRPGWRRGVKNAVVPRLVRRAAGALVTGTLARRSMLERGARPERVHVFANTVDVDAFGEQADRLAASRPELRDALGLGPDEVAVLSVGRLVPEKAHDVLVRAVAAAGNARLVLVLAGDGPERERLEALAAELGVRLVLLGDRPWERIVETYVAADVFALLSEREPWAVVVNEAAACGLPLVLSDRVGAAPDLLRDGENGVLVPAGDVAAAAAALRRLASDPGERRRMGTRSRELVRDWGYGPSVEGFRQAVRDALADVAAR